MKLSIKKHLEKLEKNFNVQKNGRLRCAAVTHDPSIHNFDPMTIGIDADVMLILPDNGRRYPHQKNLEEFE
jgi:hypothetical protein